MMKWTAPRRARIGVAALLAAAAVVSGCGRKVLRSSDVASADYYTAEEFGHLSEEQRAEYCRELAAELEYQKERLGESESALAEILDALRLSGERARSLGEEIRSLETRADDRPVAGARAGTHVTRSGDTLWEIARRFLGEGRRWKEIHGVNRDRVPDPDRLRVGIELTIPAAGPGATRGR